MLVGRAVALCCAVALSVPRADSRRAFDMPAREYQAANALRRAELQQFEWTANQVAVFARAEFLRKYSAAQHAADLVARQCELPAGMRGIHVELLPVHVAHTWYAAFVGQVWDGSVGAFMKALKASRTRARLPETVADSPWRATGSMGRRAFTASHLLVEPLDAHPRLQALRDFTRYVGWPARSDVDHLHWNEPNGLACAYCEALLLPSETERIRGAIGVDAVCGKHCCAKGCVSTVDVAQRTVDGPFASRIAGRYTLPACPSTLSG